MPRGRGGFSGGRGGRRNRDESDQKAAGEVTTAATTTNAAKASFAEHHYDIRRALNSTFSAFKDSSLQGKQKEAVIGPICDACDQVCAITAESEEKAAELRTQAPPLDFAQLSEKVKALLEDHEATEDFVTRAKEFLKPKVIVVVPPPPSSGGEPQQAKTGTEPPLVKSHRRDGAAYGLAAARADKSLLQPPASRSPLLPLPTASVGSLFPSGPAVLPLPAGRAGGGAVLMPNRGPLHTGNSHIAGGAVLNVPLPGASSGGGPSHIFDTNVTLVNLPDEYNSEEPIRTFIHFKTQNNVKAVYCDVSKKRALLRLWKVEDAAVLMRPGIELLDGYPAVKCRISTPEEQEEMTTVLKKQIQTIEKEAMQKMTLGRTAWQKKSEAIEEELSSCKDELRLLNALGAAMDQQRKLDVLKSISKLQKDAAEAVVEVEKEKSVRKFSSSSAAIDDQYALLWITGLKEPLDDQSVLVLLSAIPGIQAKHVWRNNETSELCVELMTAGQVTKTLAWLGPVELSFCGAKFSRIRPVVGKPSAASSTATS